MKRARHWWEHGYVGDDGLISWLSNHREHLPLGTLPRTHEYQYVPIRDALSGETWWAKQNMDGLTGLSNTHRRWRKKQGEIAYTPAQYELVRWALWATDNGWPVRQVFDLYWYHDLWVPERGQTPLTSRMIQAWRSNRAKMKKRGWRWP